jgi:hypothetical protein
MPLIVLARLGIPDHVVIRKNIAVRADDGARTGPVNSFTGDIISGNYLHDSLKDFEANTALQTLCTANDKQAAPKNHQQGTTHSGHHASMNHTLSMIVVLSTENSAGTKPHLWPRTRNAT